MTYTVKDHGIWAPYFPDPLPEWAAALGGNIAFLRSNATGADWYAYLKQDSVFQPDSVVANPSLLCH